MVISLLLRRSFSSVSSRVLTKFVEKVAQNRLCIKKVKTSLLPKKLYATYEGDGKTVGFVVNKQNADVFFISEVLNTGFILVNGIELAGSIILFPHSLLSWNILNVKEISLDSFTLFKILDPKIDILILGYGSTQEYPPEIHRRFQEICRTLGIRFEALPTEKAAGLYNFLADERRLVAAALIPPSDLSPFKYDIVDNTFLFEEEDEYEALPVGPETNKPLLN